MSGVTLSGGPPGGTSEVGKDGRVTLGSGPGVDIPVQGTGVSPLHCHIENSEGVVTIYPLSENLSIDGAKVNGPTRLSQGVMLTIGRSNYLRFNHPAEAKLMKSVLPNPRISMAPITFEPADVNYQKFNKKPPAVPKKSPRESLSDSDEAPSSIMTKVSKFEYLAAQNLKKSYSPKVFTSNVPTVNVPVKDVLGKDYDSLSLRKSLPQSAVNYVELNTQDKQQNKTPGQIFRHKQPQYVNVTVNETKNINNRVIIYENGCIPKNNPNVNFDHNDLNNKTVNKNVNINKANMSPSFSRNPQYFNRSPSPASTNSNLKIEHRRSGSVGEEDFDSRKYEAEVRRNQQSNHYENVSYNHYENLEQETYENVYPSSPRTRIKTFVGGGNIKSVEESIDSKFAVIETERKLLKEAERVLRQNLHNSKEITEESFNFSDLEHRKSTPTKFIYPIEGEKDRKSIESKKDEETTTNDSNSINSSKVENSNMKDLGNQPTQTELVENTVSHISKFSWRTSEGNILKLFACKEEGEKLIFPKFQKFLLENNNMRNIGNQPTITELIENTVSHISKFSWKTSEGNISKLFACKEEGEKLIFPEFKIFLVENNNMRNIGNHPKITELIANTVSHISEFSWKTSEGKILKLLVCKEEVENSNMKDLGNQPTQTELVENTVSHISKFSWRTSEGNILKLFACKEEGEKLIFPKFENFPVENSNMKNLGNQPTETELVENTVSHISKFSWRTSEGNILKLFACKEEVENSNMKDLGNQPTQTELVENTVSHISKFSWRTSEGNILKLFACKEEGEKLIFPKFQKFLLENNNMRNIGNQPTITELIENTVSHISKFSWKTSEGNISKLFACKEEGEKLIFPEFQIFLVENNNMRNIGNHPKITELIANTVSHISEFSWKTSEGKILKLLVCKEEVENSNMKNLGNQPTETELVENTVSHISKFSWRTSEGNILKLFACKEEVENSNMKDLGNQPTETELVENTVSHISKFSWRTSEGNILKLFACKEEGEKLIFPKFQKFLLENNNMRNIGNQPTITELIENTVSHISKFSWRTSEGNILKLFACKEEGEKLIFPKFQKFLLENNNMRNIGNQPKITELIENTVSHISKFSWKTSEGNISKLFACKEEGEKLIFPEFQIFLVENNNMRNIGNHPKITELIANTVSHISEFSWKTSEGKILKLLVCKEEEEGEKLIFPKFENFPVENSNMKNLGNQPTETELVENTVSHISKFSWRTSEGNILKLFACKEEGEKLIFPKFQKFLLENNNMRNIGNQPTITELIENTVSHISKFSWKTSEGNISKLFACKEEGEKLIFPEFQIFLVENNNMRNIGNHPKITELIANTVSHISEFSWKTSEGKILKLLVCKEEEEGEKLIFPKFENFPVENSNMKNLGNQPTETELVENTVSHISKFSWRTSEGNILKLFACKEEVENSNMKDLGNQPTQTELVENTVSHISKFSWRTSEGNILKLFACKEEGEKLIFSKFQKFLLENNNMRNIGNHPKITELIENTVSHISEFSWKTSEGKILKLLVCKEEVENSNMKNLGNQPTETELVENTVSHISKFFWKTSEGKILTLFACKEEGKLVKEKICNFLYVERKIELEKALINGEFKSKQLELEKLETKKQKMLKRAQRIEDSMRDCQMKQDEDQQECKQKLESAQQNMNSVEEKLKSTEKTSPDYERVFEDYLQAQEQLDNERKNFEDLEFHHLEEEADWLASREELQREILDLSNRIENLKVNIQELDNQRQKTSKTNSNEYKTIERQKLECMVRLEEIRNRLKSIDNELLINFQQESDQEGSSDESFNNKITDLSCSMIVSEHKIKDTACNNMSQSFNEKMLQEKCVLEMAKKFPSQDDIDRFSKVTLDAPIIEGRESLGRKTIESLQEIERNRHLHLCQQGSQVIENERQRVLALKQRVQEEVKTQWAQQRQDECARNSGPDIVQTKPVMEPDIEQQVRSLFKSLG
ncbi:unnamed protein product [Ceutorhynchus assimilis]|uniref:FHA domain-containing protein n=1 Tax=Ceutorhynchus assimilis TaxID=467358 RepID=A0A9N9QL82_9CUCU|nr:unnamed protein product [Ceutorhynchus assimilis]